MAKAGFTQDELKYLDSLNMQDLDALIMESRGLNKQQQVQSPSGSFNQTQSIPVNERSTLDPNLPEVDASNLSPDDAEAYISQLEQKYLDPAFLESRPQYANGQTPETAIHKTIDGSTWNRVKLAFGNKKPNEQVTYLEEQYGKGNVKLSKGGNITIKDANTNAWYRLDPEGMGSGSAWDRAFEATNDVLADNADIALAIGATAATAGLSAPLAAGLTGARALGAAAAIGAQGRAVAGGAKVLMGRLAGTYEGDAETIAKDIALETLLSAGGNTFIPGVKYGAKQLGGMFSKTAAVASKASDPAQNMWTKALAAISGQPEDVVEHWVKNGSKVAQQMSKYGHDAEGALLQSIDDTQALSKSIIQARNSFGNKIYGDFGKEAGEEFSPWIGKVFTSKNVVDEIDLVKNGVLKWDSVKGALSINSADDILKANPVSGNAFMEKENLQVLKPVVDLINQWNKLTPATGENGAKQFIAFKVRLADAVKKAEAIAYQPGKNMGDALRQVKDLQAQIKTQFLNKAVDASKAPELVSKLANIDKAYAQMKQQISPFEDAVRSSMRKGGDKEAYRRLYENIIHKNSTGTKKALVKSQLQSTIDILSPYAKGVDLSEVVDTMGARKAALAAVPWMRGGLDSAINVGTTALSVASANPLPLIVSTGVRSPRLNYKLASSAYNGLSYLRGIPDKMRVGLLQDPAATTKYFQTILDVPGIEASVGAEMLGQLTGKRNGQ